MASDQKIALLGGAGTMGMAVVKGLLEAGDGFKELTVTARHERSLAPVQELGVAVGLDNRQAVKDADVLIICVHPDQVAGLLEEVRDLLDGHHLVISVATGITTRRMEALIGGEHPVVRATPNLAAIVQSSITVICAGQHATEDHLALARAIFETVGEVEKLDERHMNACTALCGCGPAFVFKMIEALAEGGVKMGLPRGASKRMASQMMLGAAKLVLETGSHPAELKDQVTTPGGCTIDGITKLEERGLPIALIEAVETSARKAAKLFEDS